MGEVADVGRTGLSGREKRGEEGGGGRLPAVEGDREDSDGENPRVEVVSEGRRADEEVRVRVHAEGLAAVREGCGEAASPEGGDCRQAATHHEVAHRVGPPRLRGASVGLVLKHDGVVVRSGKQAAGRVEEEEVNSCLQAGG